MKRIPSLLGPSPHPRPRAFGRAALVLAWAALVSCSSSNGGANGVGGHDAGTTDAPTGSPDAGSTAIASYCSEVSSYAARCSARMDACDKAIARDCASVYATYRPEYVDALDKCGLGTTCSSSTIDLAPEQACETQALSGIPPTASEQKLASDLCGACPPLQDGGTCPDSNFWTLGKPCGGGCVSASGPGTSFLFLTDSLVTEIESSCLGSNVLGPKGSPDCWASFYACVAKQQEADQPADYVAACSPTPGG